MATLTAETNRGESPLLVVAAMGRELAPLTQDAVPGLAFLKTGMGVLNARRSLESHLLRHRASALIGIGFAGALSSALNVGDLIIAREVWRDGQHTELLSEFLSLAEAVRRTGGEFRFGKVLTVDQIVDKAESKRVLAQRLGPEEIGCVDMESAALVEISREHRLPLLVIRCVTDTMNEDLPLDLNSCVRSDGTLSLLRMTRAVLSKPASVAQLLELRRRSDMCARRMAVLVRKISPLLRDYLQANTKMTQA